MRWAVTHRLLVVAYQRFGTFFCSSSQRMLTLEDGTDRLSRTSVNYQHTA